MVEKIRLYDVYLCHALCGFGMWASGQLFVNFLPGDVLKDTEELGAQNIFDGIVILAGNLRRRGHRRRKVNLAHRGHEGDDLDSIC